MANQVGAYNAGLSAKKAGVETASSVIVVLVTAILGFLLSSDGMTAVMTAFKDNPQVLAYLPTIFIVLRYGLKFWQDRQKHKDPAFHIEHGVPAVNAEKLAVASGADPAQAKKETREAVLDTQSARKP